MARREGSNPNRQIRSLVLGVDLVGSRRIWPLTSEPSSVQTDPDRSCRNRVDDQTDDQMSSAESRRQASDRIEAPDLESAVLATGDLVEA
jgi:hypothetical protein